MATPDIASKKLQLTVITPSRAVLSTDAAAIVAPAFDGEVGVLPGHAPMLALLGSGELRVNGADGKLRRLGIRGGFMQVADNKVTVLTPESCSPEDLKSADFVAEAEKLNAQHPVKLEEREALENQKFWLKLKEKIRAQ